MSKPQASTTITLPQMVDLALNSPEVGIVNFTVLHSLLHVIVQQLNLTDCSVEFRGSDAERLQTYIQSAKPGPIITLTEYIMGPEGPQEKVKKPKGTKEEKGTHDEKESEKADHEVQTLVVVEQSKGEHGSSPPNFPVAITQEHYQQMQTDIADLHKRVNELSELPKSLGLITTKRTSADEIQTQAQEVFQFMTINKRLDAADQAIIKLGTMIEDLAKESPRGTMMPSTFSKMSTPRKSQAQLSVKPDATVSNVSVYQFVDFPTYDAEMAEMELRLANIESAFVSVHRKDQDVMKNSMVEPISLVVDERMKLASSGKAVPAGSKVTPHAFMMKPVPPLMVGPNGQILYMNQDITKQPTSASSPTGEGGKSAKVPSKKSAPQVNEMPSVIRSSVTDLPPPVDLMGIDLANMQMEEALRIVQTELQRVRKFCGHDFLQTIKELNALKSAAEDVAAPPEMKFVQMKMDLSRMSEQISSLDTMYNNQIAELNEKFNHLREVVFSGGAMASATNEHLEVETFNRITSLQDEMRRVHDTLEKLWEERDQRQNLLDMIQENIEVLKNVKADKEEMDEALANKADACLVHRKVSFDLFDETREMIMKQIEDLVNSLEALRDTMTNNMADLSEEISKKAEISDMENLEGLMEQNFHALESKIQALAKMKDISEAAGTKSKFLRNVNCISCDNKALMRKEVDASFWPKKTTKPPGKSMGPYLAYELDQLRKQQKCVDTKSKKFLEQSLVTGRSDKTDELCNRYCGGSHTVTTPMQRVTRPGHFLEQWGPEISPVVDEVIRGTDGKMYRGRDDDKLKKLLVKTKENVGEKKDDAQEGERKENTRLMNAVLEDTKKKSHTSLSSVTKGKRPSSEKVETKKAPSVHSKQSETKVEEVMTPVTEEAPITEDETEMITPEELPPMDFLPEEEVEEGG